MKVEYLDYRQLPAQSPLFLHYLYHSDSTAASYSPVHISLEHLKLRAESLLNRPPAYPRDELVSLLSRFNRKVSTSERVAENLEKLRSAGAVAILTGQQLGLFGGSALSVYKAATAIRLAQILEREGVTAVPVFWLASDDSDFEEVRSTCFFNDEGQLLRLHYPESPRHAEQMVGTLPLKLAPECLDTLVRGVSKGGFHDTVIETLSSSYAAGHSFREGLAAWLSALFQDYGLLLFDPLSPDYKKGLQSPYSVAIERRKEIVRALRRRAEFLKAAGFDVQVQAEASETFLFFLEGERRFKLEFSEGRYRTRDLRFDFSERELRQELQKNPEKFAPNVLLRPILQDHLFPTLVYVGGPAEISYFSQVSAMSPFWGIEMAVFPRAGSTIVDRKAQRLLEKYDLKVIDIFSSTPFEITQKILMRGDTRQVVQDFESLSREVKRKLAELQKSAARSDPSLAEMLEGAEKKVIYQIDRVKNRFISNYRNRSSNLGQHLDYLYTHLYPDEQLQERAINFNQFLIEEGPDFVRRLVDATNPFSKGHQVLYL